MAATVSGFTVFKKNFLLALQAARTFALAWRIGSGIPGPSVGASGKPSDNPMSPGPHNYDMEHAPFNVSALAEFDVVGPGLSHLHACLKIGWPCERRSIALLIRLGVWATAALVAKIPNKAK
jgi:hypothetical protein